MQQTKPKRLQAYIDLLRRDLELALAQELKYVDVMKVHVKTDGLELGEASFLK